ncbi:MAG: LLM class F420-dependent oxidoreductase [SAR202 cluster bacterium]|nr:LLM class F420-dependent oxidoreductase [SAR202 cluster bacterium]
MKIGAVFPQTEIGADVGAVRAFAQAAETLGFDHLVVYDHVLGADFSNRPERTGFYNYKDTFHEVFVLFGYLTGATQRLGLTTGVLVLPQRQTALVAKQAAEIDVLSKGRLRLGIGIGWNDVEFEALGEDFHSRGLRSEEQVRVLKLLWTRELVSFEGRWHKITDAGINPLPVQRPIPVWFGGGAEQVLQRIAKLGDGWFYPGYTKYPDDESRHRLELLHEFTRAEGRDPASIGIEKIVKALEPANELKKMRRAWQQVGATHFSASTMGLGLKTPDEHIAAIRQFKQNVTG